ncbi:hypothetical protein PVK06_007275 [Gossypium arboreum]|uniref:Uncharacterized protein n=1 Tax=Gossypium arboreum TaxID=29729 RepID=A0ABR0QGW9_GOSAR|nr:hypothetical protein PVK06_007275 [Gossypium arboreum]
MREALVEWIVVSVSDLHREYTLFEATRLACRIQFLSSQIAIFQPLTTRYCIPASKLFAPGKRYVCS